MEEVVHRTEDNEEDVRVEDLDTRAKEKRLGKFLAMIKLKKKKKQGTGKYPAFQLGADNREANRAMFGSNKLTTYKYTLLSFLPKNLFEQFRKATNIYFLVLTILTFIELISPLPGWTAALPFALVLLAGMIKEGIEDYKRHAADKIINNRLFTTIGPDGRPQQTRSEDIVVGDYVVLQQNQEVPADCLVLATSDNDGLCYIETAQLDGETNLKRRYPYRATERLEHEGFVRLEGTVYCSTPSFHLDEFSGAFELRNSGKRQPVDDSNLVIRGTQLRNTSWIVCLVCYTGFATKLALNSSSPPSKYSALNKMVDKMVLVIMAVQVVFCIVAAALAAEWQASTGFSAFYLYPPDVGVADSASYVGVLAFFTYLILLSYVVPQTLMISLEVSKLVQGRWMEWDIDMALDPERVKETGIKARSTDQNDELGRVKWIMSDKTGTLTANEMKMMEAVVGGVSYRNVMTGTLLESLRKADVEQSRLISEYLFCLAVCHTVTIGEVISEDEISKKQASPWKHLFTKVSSVFKKSRKNIPADLDDAAPIAAAPASFGGSDGIELDPAVGSRSGKWRDLIYKGSSPDEEAFVKFTLRNGFVFSSRVRDDVEVTVEIDKDHPDPHRFQILHNLEYTSARAKMSVIARDDFNGQICVYVKGADSAILPLVDADLTPRETIDRTTETIDRLAATGLRTLVVARRTLDPEFYAAWAEKLRRSMTGEDGTSLEDRKAAQLKLYEDIEASLELLGVTAVEDRLQDNVPDCIAFFLKAGIRFVMITGDKLETAENIAFSTRLFNKTMTVVRLADANDVADADRLLQEAEVRVKEAPSLAIVVDGATLKFLLKHRAGLSGRFYELLHGAAAVVCCRANPRIKAKVVSLVRTHRDKDMILAIGDGANDVSMIQKAHIGVGIVGKDGTQAARCSDYAIGEFQHLKKLTIVHGRWCYLRNSTIVQYWVYKNCAFIFVLFWFGIDCGWSGLNYYDSWVITLYNVFFTALPPVFFAFAEQDVTKETAFKHPQLYRECQEGKNFNMWTLSGWIVEALYCSVILYFFPFAAYQTGMFGDGSSYGVVLMGNTVSIFGITVVNLRMIMETRNFTWFIHLSYIISFLLLLLVMGVETAAFDFTPIQYGVFQQYMASGIFWMLYIITVATCLLPAFVGKYLVGQCCPWDSQIAREEERLIKRSGRRTEPLTRVASVAKLVPNQASQDELDF